MSKVIEVRNTRHLGDCVYTVIILNKARELLETNDIRIKLSISEEYVSKVRDFLMTERITLCATCPEDTCLDMWIGNDQFTNNWYSMAQRVIRKELSLNQYYVIFANEAYQKLGIQLVIDKIEYEDPDLLTRYDNLPEKYKDVDYFFVNSKPMSRQYNYLTRSWNRKIIELSQKFKVVTTFKVNGVTCVDDTTNMSIKDMASLSTHAKNIIAISTGPLVGCINTYTVNNVGKCLVYARDGTDYFSYPNFSSGNGRFFIRGIL